MISIPLKHAVHQKGSQSLIAWKETAPNFMFDFFFFSGMEITFIGKEKKFKHYI